MHIIGGFESNRFLEMAIIEVGELGVSKDQIVVIEMKNQEQIQQFFDSKSYSDGHSILDGIAAWSVVGALFGIIWGSRAQVGPIATGLLGFAIGAFIGFLFEKRIRNKRKEQKVNFIDFIIIIKCNNKEHLKIITSLFQKYHAISIGYHTKASNETS